MLPELVTFLFRIIEIQKLFSEIFQNHCVSVFFTNSRIFQFNIAAILFRCINKYFARSFRACKFSLKRVHNEFAELKVKMSEKPAAVCLQVFVVDACETFNGRSFFIFDFIRLFQIAPFALKKFFT